MRLSKMANCIEPSLTRKLFNLAKQYEDVIDFTLGDPDLPTPINISIAGCKAITDGHTHYSANAGILPLRQKIASNINKELNLQYNPEEEIIVTVGGMEAIYLTLCCLLNEGDEVIMPAPYWVNYVQMVKMCGGVPVIINTCEDNCFSVTSQQIEEVVSERTKLIILNSPNNPTGEILNEETLLDVAELAIKYDFYVLSDEVYKNIIYDEAKYKSICTFSDMKERCILINSFSKKFSMTGWRIGYAASNKVLIESMVKLQENIVACAPMPSQLAAIEAIETDISVTEEMRKEYEARRSVITKGINSIDKLSCRVPSGTFYVFVNIKNTGLRSEEFAYRLLEEQHVAVVPGKTYGDNYDTYIRIAFTMSINKLDIGVQRLTEFVMNL